MINLEFVEDVSPDGGEGLLAIVARDGGPSFKDEISFITKPDEQLQVAEITMTINKEIKPHLHRLFERRTVGTPEVIIVKSGLVQFDFYSSSGEYVASIDLKRNDLVVILRGGHGLKAKKHSELLEVKQGPYAGNRNLDKDDTWKPRGS